MLQQVKWLLGEGMPDLDEDHQSRRQWVDEARHDANGDGGPGVDSRAASSDGHQTGQSGVAHGHDVPVVLACLELQKDGCHEQTGEASRGRGQGGGHGCI